MLLTTALAVGAAQAQVDYRWFDAFGNGGVVVAGVRNAAGSYIRMTCSAGSTDPKADFQYDRKRGRFQKDEAIQVVVGSEVFQFNFDKNGFAQVDARTERVQLERLVDAIAKTKSGSFIVETPRLKSKESFSTKDAAKILISDGKNIVSGCG